MAAIPVTTTLVFRPPQDSQLAEWPESAPLGAPADHWEVPNNGDTALMVRNEHATQEGTVTLETPALVDGNAIADRDYRIPAGRRSVLVGPWPVSVYGRVLIVRATDQGTLRITALRLST